MPLHSIIIINEAGNLLYSKYFDDVLISMDEHVAFEQQLFRSTRYYWTKSSGTELRSVSIEDTSIVFKKYGDLVVFANGRDDYDESICKKN